MKKAERLLDLIAFLLNRREPVTFDEIQSAFPEDYGQGSEQAIARKFERDKADIVEMGLPLRLYVGERYDKEGYAIERDSYGLDAIDLGPEELALLYLAGSAALELDSSPFERDLVLALNKIAFAAGETEQAGGGVFRPPRSLPTGRDAEGGGLRRKEHLAALHRAIVDRKTVTLSYQSPWKDASTTRKVDPFGLAWRRGTWILVGHCHLRQAIRVFHVDRMRGLAVNPLKPRAPDFEVPDGFALDDCVAAEPWLIQRHAPVRARVRFEPPVAASAAVELGPVAAAVETDGEARILELEATWLEGLVPMLLGYRHRVRVLEPPELIERVRAGLQRLAAGRPAGGGESE